MHFAVLSLAYVSFAETGITKDEATTLFAVQNVEHINIEKIKIVL